MRRAAIVSAILVSIAAGAKAAEHYPLMGMGTTTCGNFADFARVDSALANREYFDWAQGLNAQLIIRDGKNAATKDLNAISVESEQNYIRNYCDQHPLGEVEAGIIQLYISLPYNPRGDNDDVVSLALGRYPMPHRPLFEIAAEITADWTALHGAAQPYMDALSELRLPTQRFGTETGSNMIQGFLINAQTWRGPVARRVKDELRAILRDFPAS